MSNRCIIQTDTAPAAIGTYSQAVKSGSMVFLSGQIPLDPQTGALVQGDFEQRVDRVFRNLQAVCQAAGGQLQDIVKLNIYVTDLGQFGALNDVMARFFEAPYPARAAVQVSALPKGTDVEMDAIMIVG